MDFNSILPRRSGMLSFGAVGKNFLSDPFLLLHCGVFGGGETTIFSTIKDLC